MDSGTIKQLDQVPTLRPLRAALVVSKPRMRLLASVVLYVLALMYGHDRYLAVEQAFWGFNVPNLSVEVVFFVLLFSMVPVFVLPLYFDRPSTLFIYAIVFCVYVPSVVIGMPNHADSVDRYFWLFSSFCIGLIACCVTVRSFAVQRLAFRLPSQTFINLCLVGAGGGGVLLFITYRDVLSFSSVDEIYAQREKGAATSLFIGYCQVYLAYFFSPVLFVTGWLKRRALICLAGFFGFLLVFMITAERTVFLMPFALVLISFVFKRFGNSSNNPANLFLFGGGVVFLIALLYDSVGIFKQLGFYFYTRLLAYPGLFVTQYYDLFADQGFTHWSHVSVIGRLAEVPQAYVGDEKWPALGKILAERVLGVQSQSNASFVTTDGVAAFGEVGVLLIFALYTAWLILLDRVSQSWNREFVLTVLFPLAFVSTNGPFFTMLTSFGGALWVGILWFDKLKFKL